MIILLIVAIVCTSIERARIESANTRCEQITYLALDSCFSNYGIEVFEEYGLMMLWESKEDFLSEYENYVDKNCDYSKDIISKPMDFLSIDFSGSEIKEILKATSNDGELIEKQICDYMEISLPSNIINELINNSKTLSQSEGINEFNEKMDVCNEYLTDVEECVEKIYDDTESLKNIEGNPKDKLLEMKSKVLEVKNSFARGGEVEKVNALYKEFLEDYIEFNQFITSVDDKMRSIMTSSNDYLVYTSDAQGEIENIKDYIDSKKGSYQKNIIEALYKEIDVIDTEILNIKEDNYGVLQNEDCVVEQRKIIQNVVQDFEESKILIETNEGLELSEIEDSSELIESILVDIDEVLVTISDFDKDNISINYNKKSGKEQKNEIVDFVEEIKDGGVINYVVKGDVSEKRLIYLNYHQMSVKWRTERAGKIMERQKKLLERQW